MRVCAAHGFLDESMESRNRIRWTSGGIWCMLIQTPQRKDLPPCSPTVSWKFLSPRPTWNPSTKPSARWTRGTSAITTAACPTPPSPAAGALAGTNPYLGAQGKLSQEPELKVEVTCRTELVDQTVEAVKAVHPYEEPVINVIPCTGPVFDRKNPRTD